MRKKERMDKIDISQMKYCSQILYQRIQIACALAILKERPLERTPENFALSLQSKLKLRWLNDTPEKGECLISPNVEHHILQQQQENLAVRLLSVLPASDFQKWHSNGDCVRDLEWESECSKSALEYDNDLMYPPLENASKIYADAEFIRSIFQLKTLTELHATIPASQYINIMSRTYLDYSLRQTIKNTQNSMSSQSSRIQRDSGISSSSDETFNCNGEMNFKSSTVTELTSSVLQYIILSCNADHLIMKSVEAIFSHLNQYASEKNPYFSAHLLHCVCTQWKRSTNDFALSVVQRIINSGIGESMCEERCFKYLLNIESDLLTEGREQPDFSIKEDQATILLKLCVSKNSRHRLLDLLLKKIGHLIVDSKEVRDNCEPMDVCCTQLRESCNAHIMERRYFLLLMVKCLISSRKNQDYSLIRTVQHSENPSGSNRPGEQITSVANLWRQHYRFSSETKCKGKEEVSITGHTNNDDISVVERVERMLIDTMDNPLVSIYLGDCLK